MLNAVVDISHHNTISSFDAARDAGICGVIHKATQGVPRLVNQLCDFAMLYSWSGEEKVVSEDTVKKVLSDGVFFGGYSLEEETTA